MESTAWRVLRGEYCVESTAWRVLRGEYCVESTAWRVLRGEYSYLTFLPDCHKVSLLKTLPRDNCRQGPVRR